MESRHDQCNSSTINAISAVEPRTIIKTRLFLTSRESIAVRPPASKCTSSGPRIPQDGKLHFRSVDKRGTTIYRIISYPIQVTQERKTKRRRKRNQIFPQRSTMSHWGEWGWMNSWMVDCPGSASNNELRVEWWTYENPRVRWWWVVKRSIGRYEERSIRDRGSGERGRDGREEQRNLQLKEKEASRRT